MSLILIKDWKIKAPLKALPIKDLAISSLSIHPDTSLYIYAVDGSVYIHLENKLRPHLSFGLVWFISYG